MKKSGYDYNLPALGIIISSFSAVVLIILNLMFLIKYPLSLAISLLSMIPKKGNLKFMKIYRGIQMLKSFACLYDRILANRLKLWLPFNDNQTAFQKGKPTLLHIFILRILIEIAKRKKMTLYIWSMDIEKAFDIVPRLSLLKKLIKLGIGRCMLYALKELYLFTSCILKLNEEYSNCFVMKPCIRQGAASSVLVFNIFMDDLFRYLESKCDIEEILQDIQCLIRADDTIILRTEIDSYRNVILFITDYKLNVGKSVFTVINA